MADTRHPREITIESFQRRVSLGCVRGRLWRFPCQNGRRFVVTSENRQNFVWLAPGLIVLSLGLLLFNVAQARNTSILPHDSRSLVAHRLLPAPANLPITNEYSDREALWPQLSTNELWNRPIESAQVFVSQSTGNRQIDFEILMEWLWLF